MSATPGQANPVRAFVAQLWGSVFRHGLPTNDKVAARTALTNFFLHIHPVRVKKSAVRVSYTLCLGGLSFFLFILLTITGLFLMFYYIPSVDYGVSERQGSAVRRRLRGHHPQHASLGGARAW